MFCDSVDVTKPYFANFLMISNFIWFINLQVANMQTHNLILRNFISVMKHEIIYEQNMISVNVMASTIWPYVQFSRYSGVTKHKDTQTDIFLNRNPPELRWGQIPYASLLEKFACCSILSIYDTDIWIEESECVIWKLNLHKS